MYLKQHTIQQPVTLEGRGLHTGTPSTITILPAPENHGILFRRVDLPDQPVIPADVDHVVDLSRSTTLAVGDARIHTVEHVLAALNGLQIDNARIDISGIELPILDGSAREYVAGLKRAGQVEQKANREFYVVDEPIHYQNGEKQIDLAALQFNDFRVTVMVDYNSQILGIQHATMIRFEDFEQEIAPARTFCFFHDLKPLYQAGLIKGGTTDNAIVIVDKDVPDAELQEVAHMFGKPEVKVLKAGILNNTELRFNNEPARHKLLDVIGDLSLIGNPLKAQILAARPGHASNIAFAKQVKRQIKQKRLIRKYQSSESENKGFVFDINAISKILPHRYPFLLVDRITAFDGQTIEGYKNVTVNEPFFQGHFPGNPIMPGVLILEAMGQVGGVLLLQIVENPENHWVYFAGMDGVRFKRPVVPGDQLFFKLEMMNLRRNICKMMGRAYVNDVLVCEAELTASLVKRT